MRVILIPAVSCEAVRISIPILRLMRSLFPRLSPLPPGEGLGVRARIGDSSVQSVLRIRCGTGVSAVNFVANTQGGGYSLLGKGDMVTLRLWSDESGQRAVLYPVRTRRIRH